MLAKCSDGLFPRGESRLYLVVQPLLLCEFLPAVRQSGQAVEHAEQTTKTPLENLAGPRRVNCGRERMEVEPL